MTVGIDVLGLALGAWPIIVSLLEAYGKAFKAKEALRLSSDLKVRRTIFINTVEELLSPVATKQELLAFVQDQSDTRLWRDNEDLNNRLRTHLGNQASTVLDLAGDIWDTLSCLQQELPHPTEEPPSSKFRERIKKIIRAFRKGPKTAASLQRLVYQLDDFQTLVQQNQGRAPLRHTSGHQIESIKRLRDHARDVYTVLRDGWNCECEHGHPASLRLEVWQSAGETPQPKQTGFHFLFSLAYSPSGDVSLGQVRYAEIRPLNSPKESDRGSCDPAEASPKATNSAVKRGTGRVTFQVPSSEGDQSHQTTESQEPYVTDLCEFIRNMDATTDSKTTRLGYLIDSNGQRYGIFRAQEQSPAIQGNVLSEYLGQLNSESPLIQPEGVEHGSLPQTLRFYNSDRVKLALTLAWSVLQFENTQWLGEDWSSNSILLAHGPRNVVFPYVRHSFASCRRESVANGDEKLALTRFPSLRDRPTQWVKVESLYTLGIVLIELCCGKLIEDLAIPKEMGPDGKPGPVTPFLTAMRLTKEVGHIFGSKYQEAVENCLFLKFWSADSHPSMMDESFQMGMHEAILEPLAQVVDLYPPTAVAT